MFWAKQIQRAAWSNELKVEYYTSKFKHSVKVLKFNFFFFFLYLEVGLPCLFRLKKSLVHVTKVGRCEYKLLFFGQSINNTKAISVVLMCFRFETSN